MKDGLLQLLGQAELSDFYLPLRALYIVFWSKLTDLVIKEISKINVSVEIEIRWDWVLAFSPIIKIGYFEITHDNSRLVFLNCSKIS